MAVGSLFEHIQQEVPGSPKKDNQAVVSGRRYQFAIKCYNKAISALMRRIEQQDSAEDIALLTCVLFICVEFLQGNEAEALALCVKGSKVLHSVPKTNCELSSVYTSEREGNLGMILEDVSPIFTRLSILSCLFGQPVEATMPATVLTERPPPELSFSFHTLSEARDALYNLMEICASVIRAALACKWAPDDGCMTPEVLDMLQRRMLSSLDNWASAFTLFTSSSDPLTSFSDIYASTLLRLYHLITYIWISTCPDKSETVFDLYMAEFTAVIDLSESLLAKGTASNALPPFTFEMGLIPPLYFTAINCRHPTLRRRAVSLLRQGSVRESLWDAEPMARVAERVIMLEESGLEPGTDAWPAEIFRVHDAAISQRILTRERNGYPVRFRLRPWGLDLEFSYIEEFVSI